MLRVIQMNSGDFKAQVCRAYVAGYKDYKETDYALGNAKLSQRLMLNSIGFSDFLNSNCVLFYCVHQYMNNIHLIHQDWGKFGHTTSPLPPSRRAGEGNYRFQQNLAVAAGVKRSTPIQAILGPWVKALGQNQLRIPAKYHTVKKKKNTEFQPFQLNTPTKSRPTWQFVVLPSTFEKCQSSPCTICHSSTQVCRCLGGSYVHQQKETPFFLWPKFSSSINQILWWLTQGCSTMIKGKMQTLLKKKNFFLL